MIEFLSSLVAHVYLLERECLHIVTSTDHLRVRWMCNGRWVLRWDATINDGQYTHTRLDGEILYLISGFESLDHADRVVELFARMYQSSQRLPLYPNPDIIKELSWFTIDNSA